MAFAVVCFSPVTLDYSGTQLDLISPTAAYARNDKGDGWRDGGWYGGGKGGGLGGGTGDGTSGGIGGGTSDGMDGGTSVGGDTGAGNGSGNGAVTGRAGGNADRRGNALDARDNGRDQTRRAPTVPTVALAVFTTAIEKRYPANDVQIVDDPHQAVSFFSELHAMAGRRITHRWVHNGAIMFEANFEVMAQRWRIWSTHLLPADQTGEWTVEVVDENGQILETRHLYFQPKDSEMHALGRKTKQVGRL